MNNLIQEFLSQKKFAIVGSFRNETKYAYKILINLKQRGYEVYPVNPKLKEVENIKCYPTVIDILTKIDVVVIVTPPEITEQIVEQCFEKGITKIWLQQGAESKKAIVFCQRNNIKVVYNTCIMLT